MPIWPLKLIAAFMVLLGITILVAVAVSITGQFMNPKIQITIAAVTTILVGAGLLQQKKWAIYLFFISFLLYCIANLIAFGQSHIGNSWIGILVFTLLAGLYWKRLS